MNLKVVVIGIAVFVLTLFVTSYGVNTVFNQPQRDDFCPNSIWDVPVLNESVCFDNGGKWHTRDFGEEKGYCEKDFTCNKHYNLARERHDMNVFLLSVPLGILILIGGFFFFSLESVGVGLMLGGVGTMLRGIGSYWAYSEDWVRFLISLVGLIIVIFFSYRYSHKYDKSKK